MPADAPTIPATSGGVNGGSVANLLAVWRVHGLDARLGRAWRAGVVWL